MSKISVIIPTYNRSRYLAKAIDSVLAQTYTDFEIIVVDDGSTDDTVEFLRPYVDKIKYIYQSNSGASAARNAGISAATGKWIGFLDSDDQWHVEKLSEQMDFILNSNIKVCFSGVLVEVETGISGIDYIIDSKVKKIYKDPFDLIFNLNRCLLLSTMVIEKDLLLRNGCFDTSLIVAEDTKFIYDIAFQVEFGYIDCPLVIFNRDVNRNGLISENNNVSKMLCKYHFEILNETYRKMQSCGGRNLKILGRKLSHYLSLKAVDSAICGDYEEARLHAIRSCKLGGGFKTYRRSIITLMMPSLVKYIVRNAHK